MLHNLPTRAVLIVSLLVSIGCRETTSERQQNQRASAQNAAATCPPAALPTFRDPQSAYKKYAESINAGRWCDAAATFEPEHRINLALSTFKGLLLMAGLESPNRSQYFDALRSFCGKHGLDFASEPHVASLTASILNKGNIDADLAPVRLVAKKAPEATYAELMTSVATVNGPAMATYDPQLADVTLDSDSARGFATRNDGRKIPVPFVRTPAGWLLAEP